MGSPEKCDKCGGVGRHVEGKRGFTRFPCPNATPTPPAPADDAHEECMPCGHGLSRLVYACGACRPAPDAGAAEAKPAAWAIRDRHGQYSDPSRDEAKIRRDCDYLNRDSSTPYYIGQGPYEVVPLAPLPATDDAVDEAREACVNVCRNVARSFSSRRTEDSEASHTAFIHALNAGQRLLAAEAASKGGTGG